MKFLLAFFILSSSPIKAGAPSWFSDFTKVNPGCDSLYLCSVGEGETLADATAMARTEVAKFFSTKVKSNTHMSSSSEQKSANPALASFEEWSNKTVNEETSELISGLEIKRQEIVDGRSFVLMFLDRPKTAKILKEKIESLDDENYEIYKRHSRFSYPKLLKNLILVEAYKDRYDLVANFPLKLKVRRSEIEEKLQLLKPLKMALLTKGSKLPSKLSHALIDLMSSLKVVIVKKKTNPTYTLMSELIREDLYLKVPGFKKTNVILRLELMRGSDETLGKISAESEQTARTTEQAVELATVDIKETIEKNLDQLSVKQMED